MSIVSPFHDVCVAGCLANASLSASAKTQAPAPCDAASYALSPIRAEAPTPQAAPCLTGWRRIADALFSLVSGPTLPRGA